MTEASGPTSGIELEERVAQIGDALGLDARRQVALGRRLWGAKRSIDVVLTHPESRVRLGIECKYQGTGGTAEEKISSTLADIDAWPIRGITVLAGTGFSPNMRSYLVSTGKVVELEDLEIWLRFFFGLEIDAGNS
ncbi:MAG: hypothetical protein OXI03_08970 [Chloroflexota bacterium]|nr:hypothetical protein [Chloroflexota bacterium]